MIAALLTLVLLIPQASPAVTLPDTPQGTRVAAYIKAFNAGDEKAFLTMQEAQIQPELLQKRTAEERAAMYKRMRGDFGTIKPTKVLKASSVEIELLVPNKEGIDATLRFSFDAAVPHHISSISVEIDRGPGL